MAEALLQTSDALLQRQAELWQAAVDSAARHWAEMAAGASEQIKSAMSSAVGELSHRAAVLERAVAAAGEVTRLEDALNENLAALAGAKHFEQTVLSLAAAVNMLSARTVESPGAVGPIKLEPKRRTTRRHESDQADFTPAAVADRSRRFVVPFPGRAHLHDGALVPLLLAITRTARLQAEAAAVAKAAERGRS